jgi:hypothetical protein
MIRHLTLLERHVVISNGRSQAAPGLAIDYSSQGRSPHTSIRRNLDRLVPTPRTGRANPTITPYQVWLAITLATRSMH